MTKQCRICLLDELESNDTVWVAPCRCAGSIRFMHVRCLTQWRLVSSKGNSCELCLAPYRDQLHPMLSIALAIYCMLLCILLSFIVVCLLLLGWVMTAMVTIPLYNSAEKLNWWLQQLDHLIRGKTEMTERSA